MKLIEQLMEALIRQQEANAEVVRLVAEIEAKADGRKQRKPRRKLRSWQKKSPADKAAE